MNKFAIEIVKGNNSRVISVFDTKEQGLVVGESYSKALADNGGVVVLFSTDFDEDNQPTSNAKRIFKVWDVPTN